MYSCGHGWTLKNILSHIDYLHNSLRPHNYIDTIGTLVLKKSSFIIHNTYERKKNYFTTTCTLPILFFEKNKWFMMWNCFFFLGKFTMHSSMEHWLSFQLCPLDGAHVEAPYCESWYGCLWWWDPELICIFFFFPCCYLNLVFAQAGEGKQKQKISAQKSLNNKMMVVTILKLLAEYFYEEFNL